MRSVVIAVSVACVLAGSGVSHFPRAEGRTTRVYIGTYTDGASRGIYSLEFDAASGTWASAPVLAAATENPSFLALHPSGRFLYTVNEVGTYKGAKSGAVSAFAIDGATGHLTLLNQQPSEGADPCHLSIDGAGRNALVANYTGGSIAVLPIASDGRLKSPSWVRGRTGSGPVRDRQEGPHAHAILLSPGAERFVVSADLGADRVFIDGFESARGRLTSKTDQVVMPPGSGPRHLAWHPSGRVLYVVNELSSTVSAAKWDPDRGALEILQTIDARATGATGENTGAEVVVSADGRFVYSSNRGDDNIAVFAIDPNTFTLTRVGHVPTGGHEPRNFAIDPSGRWLIAANQKSDSLVIFRLDPATGLPSAVGSPLTIPEPVCVLFATPRG